MMATVALIRDTFREAFARKIFWGLFGLSILMILFFLFLLKIDIVEGAVATVTLFGQSTNSSTDVDRLVRGFYAGIATFLYTWGMFLAVFASAGLIPSVLEPGRIELLVSKPVSRTHILLGRFAGNILVVACNVVFLVLSVWTILGIKTGIWSPAFLVSIATRVRRSPP
jgi:ABC-type transport system involved in multi-copper enzyme maturation permease subunit